MNRIYADLGITVTQSAIAPGVEDCRISAGPNTKLRLLLLPESMFSITWYAGEDEYTATVTTAVGRLIAAHAEPLVDPCRVMGEFDVLDAEAMGMRPRWSDLPDVRATATEARGGLACCALRWRNQAATLFLSRDASVPIACVAFSHTLPAPQLLTATTRLVIAHAEATRN